MLNSDYMAEQTKLEFEMLTLTNNIETCNKLGMSVSELQKRLRHCRTQLDAMKVTEQFGYKENNAEF